MLQAFVGTVIKMLYIIAYINVVETVVTLYFKTSHGSLKMWSYSESGLKIKVQ